ncbi:mCG7142, isoform CRA_b [Mus musculus]|nr:mCG7142, isoform CRA_b [Mus musculus]
MALHTVLIILSLLPMLEAQNPEHANFTIGEPITNETLSWLSDKWFFMGAAFRKLEYRQAIQTMQSEFFYLTTNLINDTIELRESQTIGDQCVYNSTHLGFQRENGTFSKYGEGVKHSKRPDITPELREVFQKAVTHVGMDESEIIFVDWKKDRCGQQEKKQLELGKETKKDPEEGQA